MPWKADQRTRYIYFVRDSVTRKIIYVGQTLHIQGRWKTHARADSHCTMLRRYLSATVHAPSFELCEAFGEGVRGIADAWAVECYYIALHDTVYNMHSNPSGCNLTSGSDSSDPKIKQRVEEWLRNGYPPRAALATPSLVEASFRVAMLEDAVAGCTASSNPSLLHALVEARSSLASAIGKDLKTGIMELARSIGPDLRPRKVSYDDACRDFLEVVKTHVGELMDAHPEDDTLRADLDQIYVLVRRTKLLFKEGTRSYKYLKKQLEALHAEVPAQGRQPSRKGTVSAIHARCRPGWPGLPTVEAAVRHTKQKRDHPPAIVGTWSDDELRWFDERIANMHTVTPVAYGASA